MRPILFCLILTCVGSLHSQTAADYTWKSAAFGGGGFVSSVITCPTEPGLIYCRTDVGGAYRWNTIDRSWIPLTDWVSINETGLLGIESLAVDPREPSRLYLLAGTSYFNGGKTAILRSDDHGASFQLTDVTVQFKAHGNGMGRQTGEKLAVDPHKGNILFCGSRLNGLFRSTNYGQTWTKVSSFNASSGTDLVNDNGISFVLFDRFSSATDTPTSRIYVGVSKINRTNLFVSSNAGISWSAVPGHPQTLMPMRAALATNGMMYLTYANGPGPHSVTSGSVRRFNTRTGTWTSISPYSGKPFGGISVDPSNPARIVCSTINVYDSQAGGGYGDRLFLSMDSGATWKPLGLSKDLQGISWAAGHAIHWAGSVEFDPFDTSRVFVTSGNGLFMTDDVEASSPVWSFCVRGLEETVPLDMTSVAGGPVVTVVGDYDGCTYPDSRVDEYVPIHNPQIGTTSGIAASGETGFLVRSGSGLYYSGDSGGSWLEFASKPSGNQGRVAVSADGESVLWWPNGSGSIYRTADLGANWTTCAGAPVPANNYPVPAADPVDPDSFYLYIKTTGAVLRSTDKGATFGVTTTISSWGADTIRCAPGRSGDIWIAGYWGLLRSVDAGASFSPVPGPSSCIAVGFGRAARGASFPAVYIWGTVGGVEGLFRSIDEGTTWDRINDDAHEFGGPGNGQFVMGDMNIFGRVYMATVGRGVIYGDPPFAGTVLSAESGHSSVRLSWTPDARAESFRVLKGPSSGHYTETNTVGLSLTWEDTALEPGETAYYTVLAVWSGTNEYYYDEVSASLTPEDVVQLRNNYIRQDSDGWPTIYLELKKRTKVRIEILDAGGSLVRELEDATLSPGFYSDYEWDLKDKLGRIVPAGVYLVIIRRDGLAPTIRKIMIVR
jgi:photosystem II stability/assembly factor-like uncharacterized protein